MPSNTIIIPTYNHLDDCLKPCLESIFKYTSLDDTEVLVVCNGCTDGTKEYLDSLGGLVGYIWFDEPLGYTKAVNEGIKATQGEYVILLNNDTILLEQGTNDWINIMKTPFEDESVMATGPLKLWSPPASREFLVFFCVTIRKKIFDEVGLLDEIFSPGGGEDTDFCAKVTELGYRCVQVPSEIPLEADHDEHKMKSNFPIFHHGEKTVFDLPNWQEIFDRNSEILRQRYKDLFALSNNYERAVISRYCIVPPREHIRYEWAATEIKKYGYKKILEIGCTSGYGVRYFRDIDGLDYTGVDYDEVIVRFARSQYPDVPGAKFVFADINEYKLEDYDVIIAFEVLEHLDNGKILAQMLKAHCKLLLGTVPYQEPQGFWGHHHKLFGLSESDFPGFEYLYINEHGHLLEKPDQATFNLMVMKNLRTGEQPCAGCGEKKELVTTEPTVITVSAETVTAVICTKNRYYTTLPLCLSAIAMQTRPPDILVIYDDSDDKKDLRTDPTYQRIFELLSQRGVQWYCTYTTNAGQVANHQHSLVNAKTEFIWRVDDDEIPDSNCLEELMAAMDDEAGAVGGCVWFASGAGDQPFYAQSSYKTKISFQPIQWYKPKSMMLKNVCHLYSTFLYRAEAGIQAGGYPNFLSVVGHHEETIFTHSIKRAGWSLKFQPRAITYHLHAKEGGIRSYTDGSLWAQDEVKYQNWLTEQGLQNIPDGNIILLECGIGDHWMMRGVINSIVEKRGEMLIAATYPEVFQDAGLPVIHAAEGRMLLGARADLYNPYGWCGRHNWQGMFNDALVKMYETEDSIN